MGAVKKDSSNHCCRNTGSSVQDRPPTSGLEPCTEFVQLVDQYRLKGAFKLTSMVSIESDPSTNVLS